MLSFFGEMRTLAPDAASIQAPFRSEESIRQPLHRHLAFDTVQGNVPCATCAFAPETRGGARSAQFLRLQSGPMLRFLTAGESHGRALIVILDGVPAGLTIDVDAIARELRRRQGGYGRGRRMAIESDRAEILSGVRRGETIGGPIAMMIENRDWANWQHTMSVEADPPDDAGGARRAPVTRPRPGHADLAGVAKFGRTDVRDVLERASARETAARVAAGAVAKQLLGVAGIRIASHVFRIGEAALSHRTGRLVR